jgi:hypothetical protein
MTESWKIFHTNFFPRVFKRQFWCDRIGVSTSYERHKLWPGLRLIYLCARLLRNRCSEAMIEA